MNCRESRPLLPLFLDGELESRQMRAVALHSTRCSQCEDELRTMERLQETIASHISAEVEQIDLGLVWSSIAPRLGTTSPTWKQRLEEWRDSIRDGFRTWAPVSAAVAAAGVLALLLWQGSGSTKPEQVAAAGDRDSGVIVESVRSNVGSLALVNEPKTDTMLMWITDDGPVTVDDLGDLP
jgi:anti-sigma factor RsiW